MRDYTVRSTWRGAYYYADTMVRARLWRRARVYKGRAYGYSVWLAEAS